MAGAALTRYDAHPKRAGKGDEEALQSRRQGGQGAPSQGVESEAAQGI
jgi:hypothetical protein